MINNEHIFWTPYVRSCLRYRAPYCLPACVFGPKTEMGSVYNLISPRPKPIIHRSTPRLSPEEEEGEEEALTDHHEHGLAAHTRLPL